jgi:hypothetical protein
MKNNLATAILLGILAVSSIAALVLCYQFISSTREIRGLQTYLSGINTRRAAITALANDAVKYSETNPAINPILESVGVKAPKPGTK